MAVKILFKTKLTDVNAADVEGVGILRKDTIGNIYRWVKNTATTALTAKQPTCYEVALVGSSAIFESVLTPATADLMMNAGIAVTAIGASGANMYGWIMAQGRFANALVLTPATGDADIEVGSELIGVNGATYLAYSNNAGTAPTYIHNYKALEAVASATGAAVVAKDVYVNCL